MMMWMALWMFVFWSAMVLGGLWLIFSRSRSDDGDSPRDVLRDRLARGEIDVSEFEAREVALKPTGRRINQGALISVVSAIVILFGVPTVIMASGGWDMDMWNMHGGGRDTTNDPVVRAGDSATIRIQDFAFQPGNLEVPVGAMVTWTNTDSSQHDATGRSGDWQTERLSKGEPYAIRFDQAGDYDYYCSIHPSMKARLVVR